MKKILCIVMCLVMIVGCKSTASNENLAKFNILIDNEEAYLQVKGSFTVEGVAYGDKTIQTFQSNLFSKGDILTFELNEEMDGCVGKEMIVEFYISSDGNEIAKVDNEVRIICELGKVYPYKLQGNADTGYKLVENKQ